MIQRRYLILIALVTLCTALPLWAQPLIVLDAGHGGRDEGAKGLHGLMEKDLALETTIALARSLEDELGAKVRLTRQDDTFIPLRDRTTFANDFDADLFVSIHFNASPKGKLRGLSTFYLDNSGDKATKKLAERENSSLEFEDNGDDLAFMLSDLIQSGKIEESIQLATSLHTRLLKSLSTEWKIRDLGVRKAPFYVLVGAHMPCVLVELFFVDNVYDSELLKKPGFREDIVRGLTSGIRGYLAAQG